MEITQILVFVVIAVELLLIFISLYLYRAYKVRIFFFLTWGFLALLISCAIQGFLAGNTSVFSSILDIAAGLFFITGALTAV